MADQFLFLTELLGLKVYDLKGRKIGVIKDAALVPLIDPVRVDRYPGRRRLDLAIDSTRPDQFHFARRHPASRRDPDPLS